MADVLIFSVLLENRPSHRVEEAFENDITSTKSYLMSILCISSKANLFIFFLTKFSFFSTRISKVGQFVATSLQTFDPYIFLLSQHAQKQSILLIKDVTRVTLGIWQQEVKKEKKKKKEKNWALAGNRTTDLWVMSLQC